MNEEEEKISTFQIPNGDKMGILGPSDGMSENFIIFLSSPPTHSAQVMCSQCGISRR